MSTSTTVPVGCDGDEHDAAGEAGPLLDEATQLGETHWKVKVFPDAREAVVYPPTPVRSEYEPRGDFSDAYVPLAEHVPIFTDDRPELGPGRFELGEIERKARNRANSARRARSRSRRYCKANRLSRLWTLTYRNECRDRSKVFADIDALTRALRAFFGEAFPFLWVIETHESGAFHVHMAAGRIIALRCRRCDPQRIGKGLHADELRTPAPCLACTWGHGFVLAQRFKGQKRAGAGAATAVAGYVAKYVGKEVEGAPPRAHSFEVAQGFKPDEIVVEIIGTSHRALIVATDTFFEGETPGFVWSSENVEDWFGPPVLVAFW